MMLFIFICATIIAAQAQAPKVYAAPQDILNDSAFINRLKDRAFADSSRNTFKYRYNPNYNTPLAGSMPKRFNYLGNNRQGFDIYQTPQDNMYILRPDSTFASNMPVAGGLNFAYKPVDMPNLRKEKKD